VTRDPRRSIAIVGVVAVLSLAVHGAAQTSKGGGQPYDPPRLRNGEPDFRGIWQVRTTVDWGVEGHPAEKGVAAAKSIIVDPPNGRIPYQPSALAKSQENFKGRKTEDPQTKCFQAGVPRATYLPSPLQIVQSPGRLAIVYEDAHTYRVIYMDGRPHYDRVDWWMGDSRGRWEGNTLVVSVKDLNDQTWFDKAGNFHSEEMHVLERYTLTGPDTLQYEATMEDPKVFTRPWTLRVNLFRHKEPGFRIVEDECEEDAQGVRRHVRTPAPR
jgi:hypothetical protein